MKRMTVLLLLIFSVVLLAACEQIEPTPTEQTPDLAFSPNISMFEEGKVYLEIGITNEAMQSQDAVEDVQIRAVVTDERGKIRNSMILSNLPEIASQETVYPISLEAEYDPGLYVVSISGDIIPSLTFQFEVREEDDIRKVAAHSDFINPFTEFTISAPELKK